MNSHKAIQETLKNFSITSDELLSRLQGDWSERDLLKVKNYLEGKFLSDYVHSTTLNYIEDALPSEAKFYYFSLRMFDNNRAYEEVVNTNPLQKEPKTDVVTPNSEWYRWLNT